MMQLPGIPNLSEQQRNEPCRVWIRPMGLSWKVSVQGHQNANWLVQRLREHRFDVSDPLSTDGGDHVTFRCLTKDRAEKDSVERLLIKWPEVRLQFSPDDSARPILSGKPPADATAPHEPAPQESVSVKPFRVWLRPLGNAWKIRVEGSTECDWLQTELMRRELACSTPEDSGKEMLTFRCMSETPHEASYVWGLLKAMSQVLLQNEPA